MTNYDRYHNIEEAWGAFFITHSHLFSSKDYDISRNDIEFLKWMGEEVAEDSKKYDSVEVELQKGEPAYPNGLVNANMYTDFYDAVKAFNKETGSNVFNCCPGYDSAGDFAAWLMKPYSIKNKDEHK